MANKAMPFSAKLSFSVMVCWRSLMNIQRIQQENQVSKCGKNNSDYRLARVYKSQGWQRHNAPWTVDSTCQRAATRPHSTRAFWWLAKPKLWHCLTVWKFGNWSHRYLWLVLLQIRGSRPWLFRYNWGLGRPCICDLRPSTLDIWRLRCPVLWESLHWR